LKNKQKARYSMLKKESHYGKKKELNKTLNNNNGVSKSIYGNSNNTILHIHSMHDFKQFKEGKWKEKINITNL